ncbi:hypothetical protein D3C85_1128800 [compost metagenome]
MGMTQPLTAVGQVQTHGGPRRIGILTGNGVVDFFVLTAQATHVVLLVVMGQARGVQPCARNDAGAQVGHDVGEVAVAGGQRDFEVEGEVRSHGVTGVSGTFIQRIEGGAHVGQLFRTATLRRQPGRLHFQTDAQFQDRQHISQGYHSRRVDTETARARRVEHEGADTVAGFHLPCRLQTGNRLAHHRAADTMGIHDGRLGGQLVATLEMTVADLLGQHRHQFLSEAAALAWEAWYVVRVFHGEHLSRKNRRLKPHHSATRLYDHHHPCSRWTGKRRVSSGSTRYR